MVTCIHTYVDLCGGCTYTYVCMYVGGTSILSTSQTRRRETCEEQLKLKRQELARMSRESAVVEKKMRTKEADLSKLRPEFINAKQKSAHVMKRLQASK